MRKLMLLTGLSLGLLACGGGGGGDGSSDGGDGANLPIPTACLEGTYITLDKANIVVQDVNGNILPKNSNGEWVANDVRVKIVVPYRTDAGCVVSGIGKVNLRLGGDWFYSSPITWHCFGGYLCEKSFFPEPIEPTPPTTEYSFRITYHITAEIGRRGRPWEAISDSVHVNVCVQGTQRNDCY